MVSTPTSLSGSGLNSALLTDPRMMITTVMTHGLRQCTSHRQTRAEPLFSHGVLANHPWKEGLLCPFDR